MPVMPSKRVTRQKERVRSGCFSGRKRSVGRAGCILRSHFSAGRGEGSPHGRQAKLHSVTSASVRASGCSGAS